MRKVDKVVAFLEGCQMSWGWTYSWAVKSTGKLHWKSHYEHLYPENWVNMLLNSTSNIPGAFPFYGALIVLTGNP